MIISFAVGGDHDRAWGMIKQVPGQGAKSDSGKMRIPMTLYDEQFG
jgi:hypothetical protein